MPRTVVNDMTVPSAAELLELASILDGIGPGKGPAILNAADRKIVSWALRVAARQDVSVTVETRRLVDAMWQLLDDMGAEGKTVFLASKVEARVAYEPFRDKSEEYADWMSIEEAERLLKECDQ